MEFDLVQKEWDARRREGEKKGLRRGGGAGTVEGRGGVRCVIKI
jgi:hypothetical protein